MAELSVVPSPAQHVEWEDGRPVWVHPCTDRVDRITLPLGTNLWRADESTDTLLPSLWCRECGTHGWWSHGIWREA